MKAKFLLPLLLLVLSSCGGNQNKFPEPKPDITVESACFTKTKESHSIAFNCTTILGNLLDQANKGQTPYPDLVKLDSKGKPVTLVNNFHAVVGIQESDKFEKRSITQSRLVELRQKLGVVIDN